MRCLDAQGPCKELLARAAQEYSIERQIWKWEICFNWLCSSDALHGPWASEHLLCTSTHIKTNKTDTKWSDMNDINFHQQLKQWKQYFDVFVFLSKHYIEDFLTCLLLLTSCIWSMVLVKDCQPVRALQWSQEHWSCHQTSRLWRRSNKLTGLLN